MTNKNLKDAIEEIMYNVDAETSGYAAKEDLMEDIMAVAQAAVEEERKRILEALPEKRSSVVLGKLEDGTKLHTWNECLSEVKNIINNKES